MSVRRFVLGGARGYFPATRQVGVLADGLGIEVLTIEIDVDYTSKRC
jgi:hypothetical protein